MGDENVEWPGAEFPAQVKRACKKKPRKRGFFTINKLKGL